MSSTEPNPTPHSEAQAQPAPPLWNPNAAACWSLVFSPLFGAYLHMRNWQALGQPEKAEKSKKWAVASLAFVLFLFLSSFILPDTKGVDLSLRLASFALLLGWYYALGKSQQAYVLARYGSSYPRRGWSKPLSAALVALVLMLGLILAIAYALEPAQSAA